MLNISLFFFTGPLKIWTKGLKEEIGKENFQKHDDHSCTSGKNCLVLFEVLWMYVYFLASNIYRTGGGGAVNVDNLIILLVSKEGWPILKSVIFVQCSPLPHPEPSHPFYLGQCYHTHDRVFMAFKNRDSVLS